jgi:hypothetical protein
MLQGVTEPRRRTLSPLSSPNSDLRTLLVLLRYLKDLEDLEVHSLRRPLTGKQR